MKTKPFLLRIATLLSALLLCAAFSFSVRASASDDGSGQTSSLSAGEDASFSTSSEPSSGTEPDSSLPQDEEAQSEPWEGEGENEADSSLPQDEETQSEPLEDESEEGGSKPPLMMPTSALDGTMEILEDGASVIVYNYADFKAAIAGNNGYTTVYLGADITTNASDPQIYIPTSKASLVIDGCPPGAPAGTRFTYFNSTSGGYNTINVMSANTGTFSVTYQNMIIRSVNYYGVLRADDGRAGLTFTVNNVDYTGPQLTKIDSSDLCINNSTITIQQDPSGGDPCQEVAECHSAVISGIVTINSASTGDVVFWVKGANNFVTIADGANATVRIPNNSFLYPSTAYPVVTVGKNASLDLTCYNGFMRDGAYITSLLLDTGSTLTVKENYNSAYPVINTRGFSALEGSSLYLYRTGANGPGLGLYATGTMSFINPKRVVISTQSGKAIVLPSGSNFTLSADAVNLWNTAVSATDDIANMPAFIWNKASGSVSLSGTSNGAGFSSLNTNLALGTDPVAVLPTTTNFKPQSAYLLTFGSLPLTLDTVHTQSAFISGITRGGAQLSATYTDSLTGTQTLTGSAGASGTFALPLASGPAVPDSAIQVLAHSNMLKARQNTIVQDASDFRLSFGALPGVLPFETTSITAAGRYVDRQDADWSISVSDSRAYRSGWELQAHIDTPLTAQQGEATYTLPEALVFVGADGTPIPLTDTALVIYTQAADGPDSTQIGWEANRGLLLWLPAGAGVAGVTYSTAIQWALVDAP